MKFHEIPVEQFAVRVRKIDGSTFDDEFRGATSTVPVAGVTPSTTPDVFDLALPHALVPVTPTTGSGAVRLNRELAAGRALLAQLSSRAPDDSVELRIAFFAGAQLLMGDLEIGVDEYVHKAVNRVAKRTERNVHAWLEDRCTFRFADKTYFFITAGPAIEDDLRPEPEATDTAPSASQDVAGEESGEATGEYVPGAGASGTYARRPPVNPSLSNSFCVTGTDVRFVATTSTLPDGVSIYVATKLTARNGGDDRAIRLAEGRLRFADWTRTGRIRLQAEAQLRELTALESSYLSKWDEFGDLEGEILLQEARDVGAIDFTDPVPQRDGTVTVRIIPRSPGALDALASGRLTELEAVDSVPEHVTNPDFTFSDFSRALVDDQAVSGRPGRGSATSRSDTRYLEVERFDRETMTLTIKGEHMPAFGTLVMSMAGDVAQIKRRLHARKSIISGRSANPQLGVLIEEQGEVTSLRSPQKIEPLTAFVRNKVFKNPPTEMQEWAVEVALNTPDIALIQGPPGTGKTTVIAAVLERLNEISTGSGEDARGQVLLTGFQHDAVENMIDRVSLNGLPVPKFGKRTGSAAEDLNVFEKGLEEWCGRIAHELRGKNPQIAELEQEAAIKDLYMQYLRTPTRRLAATLVSRVAAVDVSILGEDLSRQAARLDKRLSTERRLADGETRPLRAVQRIRTRPESFADDGPDRANDALVDLEDLDDLLSEEQAALLDRASAWRDERGTPPFLHELATLKRSLLVALTAPPVFRIEKASDEVLHLVRRALDEIRRKGLTTTDKRTAALAEFLAELENNPVGMVDAVSEFSYAFAATVQQSVNREMQRRKGITGAASHQSLEYEYVIVDEAARVSPRDLMIPMAQGKKIILVGDHRQLPHIIDEAVARRMDSGEDDLNEDQWLKRSMFEYLFSERLGALEAKDGIPRRVTLDTQFRMHPQLGDFVSRNFYERFERSERFGSGLPAAGFAHHLPGTDNRPAMWLDVRAAAGPAKRSGTSWTRRAEADAIAHQLLDWIQSATGQGLTYGVISFYKAQADLIRSELRRRLGADAYDEQKIRVGTVDSFQGMEFDVVFLSVVRTIPPGWNAGNQPRAMQARRLFGHLCLYNRLNVSMSRQKRLLVVAGDSALVKSDLAAEFIPGLVDFFELARHGATGTGATATSSRRRE